MILSAAFYRVNGRKRDVFDVRSFILQTTIHIVANVPSTRTFPTHLLFQITPIRAMYRLFDHVADDEGWGYIFISRPVVLAIWNP